LSGLGGAGKDEQLTALNGEQSVKFLATMILGAFFALVTALMVLVYWLMTILFRALYLLTLPLHWLWRSLQRAS
jgi:hypothetical protein